MDKKNLLISGIAVFIVSQILDYVSHDMVLGSAYEATAQLWRSDAEMMSMMWVMYVVGLLWAFIFVYVFGWASKGEGIMEGVKFGFCIGLFVITPMAFNTYAVMPVPFSMAVGWFATGMIKVMVCGAVLSLVYKPSQPRA